MEKKDDGEGERIRLELEKKGMTVADLRRACGVTWSGAKKYLASDKLGDKAWATCKSGLIELGIDPDAIRPSGLHEIKVDVEALKQELSAFGGLNQLQILRRMLGAPDAVRRSVIDAIDGALLWRRNRG